MKRQLIAAVIGTALAAPVFANNEIDVGYTPPAAPSASTAGWVFVDAEQGYALPAAQASGKSRADVVSEVEQARRSGNYVINAELGTRANPL